MLLPRELLLLLWAGTVAGFRPNHESGGIAPGDFTDADITEMGVLRAVAWYMERNPLPGKPAKERGELEFMKPLTASRLFQAHFQANVSANRFVKALKEIIDGNNQVEIYHAEDSSFFFHCEDIGKSIQQFRLLQDSVLSSLKGPVTSAVLESARLNTGKALHILQKFYSNTNWIELGNIDPYEHLLNGSHSAFPVAPVSKTTCKDCTKESSGLYSCQENILVDDLLTSGYKLSATCKTKPPGKCGHGGINDMTQNYPPTGGINKETSDPLLSPHYHLHKKAAELAIQATRDFFVGTGSSFFELVGRDIFKKFFNLEGYSLTFVIDTTGSMSDDIAKVKEVSINLLRKYSGSPDAPYNYILVPFNDPAVGPVRITQSVDTFKYFIGELKATDGGDCPEMSLTGLKLALQKSMPRSKIFVFTDAGAKDAYLSDEIKVLIDSSQSEVNHALTGYCSSRKRRNIKETSEASHRLYSNLYEELAAYSGGYYMMTTKTQLTQVLGLMELSLNAAPVKVTRAHLYGTQFSFPVDECLTEITVSVKNTDSSIFSMSLLKPSGAQVASTQTVISTGSHKVVKVSRIDQRGTWSVTMSPSGSYEVEIGGKSLFDFSYQIMQQWKEFVLPIQGRPVKGSSYTVSLKMMGESRGAQIQRLVSVSEQRDSMGSIRLNQTSDATGSLLAIAPLSFQSATTLLRVEGLSPGGLNFSRINPDPVSSESIKIVPIPGQNGTMPPGGLLNISVLVVNDGSGGSFSFNVWDHLGFLQSFSPRESVLNSGETCILSATFRATEENSHFASSIATFAARSSSAQNYLKLPITVIPESALEIDDIPPVHKLLNFDMPCLGQIQHQANCSRHIWNMTFSAKDDHSAITVKINTDPSHLSCQPRPSKDNKDVICQYYANCCSPYSEVLISDENGNTDSFTVDYRQPRPTVASSAVNWKSSLPSLGIVTILLSTTFA